MSEARRRLSSGSGMLKMCDDENSDDDDLSIGFQEKSIYTFPKKSNSRRRSSFGGQNSSKSPVNAVEQARIADMYKTVIQMSSENKLNEKNSWNYDLIDHMGRLIKDDSRGVNFQKASCTLDASVKIYSNRVDDTYSTSHRILESLSRNGTSTQDHDEGDDNDDQEGEGPEGGRKKSSKTSNRLNIAQTIERNVAALNAVKVENDVAVDPMFHKISKAFDEGGAKGMLMNNLRLSSNGSSLAFHFPDAPAISATAESEAAHSRCIDLADLLQRSEITVAGLTGLSVCPALNMYRDQICVPKQEAVLTNLAEVLTASRSCPTAAAGDDICTAQPNPTTANNDNDWEDNDDGGCGDFGDAYGEDDFDGQSLPARASIAPFASALSPVASPDGSTAAANEFKKLRWEDGESTQSAAMSADMEVLVQGLEHIAINNAGPSEYSYFDSNAAFGTSNAWAGARHWKYATRKRTAVTQPETAPETAPSAGEGEEAAVVGSKAKKTKKTTAKKSEKATGAIDFSEELVDEALFDMPKGKSKSDPTSQTAATLSKQEAGAAALFLPPDAKVQVKDLCRLYLAPLVMIPANNQQRASLAQSAAAAKQRSGSSKIDKFMGGQAGSERVWGLSAPATLQTAQRIPGTAGTTAGPAMNASFDDADGDYGDYGCDDDGFEGNDENFRPQENALPPALAGLGINENQLLQAERKVEKIEIGYAKVSKRVNIQRLKADIWGNIRTALPGVDGEEVSSDFSASTDAAKAPGMSFQNMIGELAEGDEVRQRDVTLPFYFICLLHLANEHNLKIEDLEDMSDLVITPGTK